MSLNISNEFVNPFLCHEPILDSIMGEILKITAIIETSS
jgi:hypothetical protein